MDAADLVFNFLPVHLRVCEVSEDASKVLPVDVSRVRAIVESESVFDLVLLNKGIFTISSESLLLRLAFLPPLGLLTFFFSPFISYKIIELKYSKDRYKGT